MATSFVNVGSIANDGTGDPIRTAFITVNENFNIINGAIFAGTVPTVISATSVTAGIIISNSSITGNTITANNFVATGGGAEITGDVTIFGNLNIIGQQTTTGASQQSGTATVVLHYSETTLTLNDNKDIGTQWQYYTDIEKKGFLGWQNSTESLVYFDNITESAGNVITGTPGNVHFGSLLLSNTTSSDSTITGALVIDGGVGVGGNINVGGNIVSNTVTTGNLTVQGFVAGSLNFVGGDTIYINGSPVQTASQAFNGGIVALSTQFASGVESTSTGTGTVVILGVGGMGVGGNLHVGGNIVGNLSGNVITAAQPSITSLGELTALNMNGQINANDIIPEVNNAYNLGNNTKRFNKLWAFDTDISGTLTVSAINAAGGAYTSNLAINAGGASGITSTSPLVELFNTTVTTVRIGGAGVTQFRNNTQATSTTTGAVQVTGGMSINTGNLYINGSAGNTIVSSGTIQTVQLATFGNTQSTSSTTGAIVVDGGVGIGGNLYINGSAGNAAVLNGNLWVIGGLLPGGANVSQNIGSSTRWWNTFFGVSTQAKYADLAENYVADEVYPAGTVVVFGGSKEITTTTHLADHRVAGVISTNPAHLMNGQLQGDTVLPLALRGRVPVNVVGPVAKGDLLVTSDLKGHAVSVGSDTSYGVKIFAKSLETNGDLGEKIIEAIIL
jgi:hypothetical protein